MKIGITGEGPFLLKSQFFSGIRRLTLALVLLALCPALWAAQEGIVTTDKALIFADKEMTSPIGFVPRGKKVRVGEIPRNKAQVYPIVVSGKIAYIKVSDISTQREALESPNLVAERFQKRTKEEKIETLFSAAYFTYNSQITLATNNGGISDKDAVNWTGVSIRGNGVVRRKWELQIIGNYLTATDAEEDETFQMLETGAGLGFRFLTWGRLQFRLEGQFLLIPWSSYALGSEFRVNGRGYSTGAGLSAVLRLTDHWGIDAYSGVYYTRLGGYNVPRPYASIEPIFYGTRLGAGIHYAF